MAGLEVRIEFAEKQMLHGIWMHSNDKTISKDIRELSTRYHTIVSMAEETVLPYFVLSRNYKKQSGDFELFIGSTTENKDFERFVLPAGKYAKITVKPKLFLGWGASIGEAKRYFYTKWLPESSYEALNMEYEYHTERSTGKRPEIDIIFAVRGREES